MEWAEQAVRDGVQWLRLAAEAVGAVIVAAGVAVAAVRFAAAVGRRTPAAFVGVRLVLARFLALGLEFQLASDILSTAVSPSWDQIGKLGAIAVIRTALNFFLSREMAEEERIVERERQSDARTMPGGGGGTAA